MELPRTRNGFIIGRENIHGLDLTLDWDGDAVTTRFTLGKKATGFDGIVHGGVLAAILDEVMGWAPTTAKRCMCMAAELTFRYLEPVPTDLPLIATGRFTVDKRRLWYTEGTIAGVDGTVYVKGKGTFMPLSATQSAQIEADFLVYAEGAEKIFS